MTHAWLDVTRNAGIARIVRMSYRSKIYTWNYVILVKRSMIRFFLSNTSVYYHLKYIQGDMFWPHWAIIRPFYKNRFIHFQYIFGSQILYIDAIVVTMLYAIIYINPLNAELNLICHLLALLGAHHILHVSGIRVKVKTGVKMEVCLFKILC